MGDNNLKELEKKKFTALEQFLCERGKVGIEKNVIQSDGN